MAGTQRDRKKMSGAERRKAAAEAAKRRRQRRRAAMVVAGVVVVIGAIVAVILVAKDDKKKTTAATSSKAGKPCVPVAGPVPAGAPEVPVKVGPPPTQLVKEDLKEGTGATVNPNETVTVNYIGVACTTGKIFDSSYSRNKPATFPLTQVIKGWTDGIPGMKVGGQRLLGIPPDMAYGAQGRPPDIGPNEPLWFVVEVLDAKAS